MKHEIEVHVVSGSALMTNLMQSAAVFEKWKVLGNVTTMKLTVDTKDGEITDEQLIAVQSGLKKALEEGDALKKQRVSLIHFLSCTNRDYTVEPYVDMTVKAVSDGKSWRMFDDHLRALGLIVETDDYRSLKVVETPRKQYIERGERLAAELGTLNKESQE